jgi:pyroglutamyl-peptidase
MRVLLTGFEPFAGELVNPSWEVASRLADRRVSGCAVMAERLPTVFGASIACLRTALERYRPQAVVCLGEAGGRAAISIERVALNLDEARIPDNKGQQPVEIPVEPDGPAAYFTTLPVRAIVAKLLAAGIPAEISRTAGGFVCNHTFYGLMHHLGQATPVRAGFIHIPYLPEQAVRHPGKASMELATTLRGIEMALEVLGLEQFSVAQTTTGQPETRQ